LFDILVPISVSRASFVIDADGAESVSVAWLDCSSPPLLMLLCQSQDHSGLHLNEGVKAVLIVLHWLDICKRLCIEVI